MSAPATTTSNNNALRRRLKTVPGLVALATGMTITIPLWLALAVIADAARLRFRFPTVRLMTFGLWWVWLEVVGVVMAFRLWVVGRASDTPTLYAQQRWWAANLMRALRVTCGIRVDVVNLEALAPGPVLLLVRHASLADSLVTAYVVTSLAGMQPRFVLKRELLVDPCLDIVGHRVPNHFLDRGADDAAPELAAIGRLVADLGPRDVGIIFPEGTLANAPRRSAAMTKIAARDPERAARLAPLQHLLPPRPSGAEAMVRGAGDVDVAIAWHVGFEGLDTFRGIVRAINRPLAPIHFSVRRVSSRDVPRGDGFTTWLDAQWLRLDEEVDVALADRARTGGNN